MKGDINKFCFLLTNGEMANTEILEQKQNTLCYLLTNIKLLEVAGRLTRAAIGPVIIVFRRGTVLTFVPLCISTKPRLKVEEGRKKTNK